MLLYNGCSGCHKMKVSIWAVPCKINTLSLGESWVANAKRQPRWMGVFVFRSIFAHFNAVWMHTFSSLSQLIISAYYRLSRLSKWGLLFQVHDHLSFLFYLLAHTSTRMVIVFEKNYNSKIGQIMNQQSLGQCSCQWTSEKGKVNSGSCECAIKLNSSN